MISTILLAISLSFLCEGMPLREPSVCNSTISGDLVYYNSTSNSCSICSNCTQQGLEMLTECSLSNDTICSCPSNNYYDSNSLSCKRCTNCIVDHQYEPISGCTATTNSICKPCPTNFYYSDHLRRCILNCVNCPNGCDADIQDQCVCGWCQTGPLCTERDISPTCRSITTILPTTGVTLTTPSSNDQSLSPISSALIAVGAVFGIIVFSACFVLLGVANSCHRTNNAPSESSSDGIPKIMTTASLASLYMNRHSPSPLYEYRTSLDILKHSSNSIYSSSSWNTLRGSPNAVRSNSAPLV